jgi:hypothetical protein
MNDKKNKKTILQQTSSIAGLFLRVLIRSAAFLYCGVEPD